MSTPSEAKEVTSVPASPAYQSLAFAERLPSASCFHPYLLFGLAFLQERRLVSFERHAWPSRVNLCSKMAFRRGYAQKLLRPLKAGQHVPRTNVNNGHSRAFHASKRFAIVRPFLLSDIGEGGGAGSNFLSLEVTDEW